MKARRPPAAVRDWWRIQHEAKVTFVIESMRRKGLTLVRSFGKPGTKWATSDGVSVAPKVAEGVIQHPDVVGCGDGLFEGALSQTYRFSE
jgi:hypothetical protein